MLRGVTIAMRAEELQRSNNDQYVKAENPSAGAWRTKTRATNNAMACKQTARRSLAPDALVEALRGPEIHEDRVSLSLSSQSQTASFVHSGYHSPDCSDSDTDGIDMETGAESGSSGTLSCGSPPSQSQGCFSFEAGQQILDSEGSLDEHHSDSQADPECTETEPTQDPIEMIRASMTPSYARYTAVLQGATTDDEDDMTFMRSAQSGEPYLGYDKMTGDNDIDDYIDMLNTIGMTVFPSFAPTFMNTKWAIVSAARIILNRQASVIGSEDLMTLYKWFNTSYVRNAGRYYDLARLLVVPVHDPKRKHWVLVVASPRARHAVVLCSLQDRRITYDNSFVLRSDYDSDVEPYIADALLALSRMVHVSRQFRLLMIHLYRTDPRLARANDREACAAIMRESLHLIDPMVLHNAPNFSYSIVPFSEPQRDFDCGVYMMHMMRKLFFDVCSTSKSLQTLHSQAMVYSTQNGTTLDDRGCALDESTTPSLMHFFLNETRPYQFHTSIDLIAGKIRRCHIVQSRITLLRDLRNWNHVFTSLDSYHPDYKPIVDTIHAYLSSLGNDASTKLRHPSAVAIHLIKKRMLGKRKRAENVSIESASDDSSDGVQAAKRARTDASTDSDSMDV